MHYSILLKNFWIETKYQYIRLIRKICLHDLFPANPNLSNTLSLSFLFQKITSLLLIFLPSKLQHWSTASNGWLDERLSNLHYYTTNSLLSISIPTPDQDWITEVEGSPFEISGFSGTLQVNHTKIQLKWKVTYINSYLWISRHILVFTRHPLCFRNSVTDIRTQQLE